MQAVRLGRGRLGRERQRHAEAQRLARRRPRGGGGDGQGSSSRYAKGVNPIPKFTSPLYSLVSSVVVKIIQGIGKSSLLYLLLLLHYFHSLLLFE